MQHLTVHELWCSCMLDQVTQGWLQVTLINSLHLTMNLCIA
jgi:hypothetical protein